MEYFVLQAKIKLRPQDNPYGITGLKNSLGALLTEGGFTPPTPASIEHGVLEWIVPNNQFNQNQVGQYYSESHRILHAGEERLFGSVKKMANMPAPLADEDKILKPLVSDPIIHEETTTPVETLSADGGLEAAMAKVEAIKKAQLAKVEADSLKEKEEAEKNGDVQLSENSGGPTDTKNTPSADEIKDPGEITPPVAPKGNMSPQKIAKLKSEIKGKLTELGIEIPRNSTLPMLEKLLQEEFNKIA